MSQFDNNALQGFNLTHLLLRDVKYFYQFLFN